jgi:hypothetical protein
MLEYRWNRIPVRRQNRDISNQAHAARYIGDAGGGMAVMMSCRCTGYALEFSGRSRDPLEMPHALMAVPQ